MAAAPITNTEISNTGWCLLHHGSLDAVVDAIGEIHIPITWWTKQRFIAGGAAAIAVARRLALAIGLRFHNHATQ